MIVRIWHGLTKKEVAEKYKQYVIDTGIKEYRETEGNAGAQIWQQREGDTVHIWTVSWWKNYESIKKFAGEDYEKARYFDEDKKYLLTFEPQVQHAEVTDFSAISL